MSGLAVLGKKPAAAATFAAEDWPAPGTFGRPSLVGPASPASSPGQASLIYRPRVGPAYRPCTT